MRYILPILWRESIPEMREMQGRNLSGTSDLPEVRKRIEKKESFHIQIREVNRKDRTLYFSPMILMTDIINDISIPEDPSASQTIDARDFFPKIQLNVISHNSAHIFDDIRISKGKMLDVTEKHTLVIKKPKKESLEDLYHTKKYTTNILSIFSKNRIIRMNPLSILEPLPKARFNTLDIRLYGVMVSERTYPDIYKFSTPLPRRIRKTLRKHRKRIAV